MINSVSKRGGQQAYKRTFRTPAGLPPLPYAPHESEYSHQERWLCHSYRFNFQLFSGCAGFFQGWDVCFNLSLLWNEVAHCLTMPGDGNGCTGCDLLGQVGAELAYAYLCRFHVGASPVVNLCVHISRQCHLLGNFPQRSSHAASSASCQLFHPTRWSSHKHLLDLRCCDDRLNTPSYSESLCHVNCLGRHYSKTHTPHHLRLSRLDKSRNRSRQPQLLR